jgi:catechol 2,3-dioxygenase-like lactoylglutathione lyase family enzyme
MIKGIRHVGIVIPDLNEAIEFYAGIGFTAGPNGIVTKEESFNYYGSSKEIRWQKMAIYAPLPQTIELYEIKGEDGYQGYNHIALEVDDIQKYYEWFGQKGILMSSKIIEKDGHKLFFATDPWLNMLEIVEPIK